MDDNEGRLAAALQASESKGRRQDSADYQREKKHSSSIQYKRRKLEKDVRHYTKLNDPIRSRDIDAIGDKHGFHIN
jgi:hypothetical protein